MNKPKQKRNIAILILVIVITVIILFVFFKLKRVIRIILLGGAITYIVHPVIVKLELIKINRKIGVAIVYLIFIALIIFALYFIVPQLANDTLALLDNVPKFLEEIKGKIESSKITSGIFGVSFENFSGGIEEKASMWLENIAEYIMNIADFIFDILLSLVVAFYFITDIKRIKNAVDSLLPKSIRKQTKKLLREINRVLYNFIQGQILISFIIALLEFTALNIIGVKYALFLAIIGGISNVIPYIGPILGVIPAAIVALIGSLDKALWTLLVYFIIQQIENNFISPKIVEGKIGLHPLITILAVFAGGELAGLKGMLFAVPLTGIVCVIIKNIVEYSVKEYHGNKS